MKVNWKTLLRFTIPLCFFFVASPIKLLALPSSNASTPVVAQLVSEEKSIQPGRPFWVGVELKISDGWDTYWHNPGDSGFPTQIKWDLPEGYQAGPIQWPYPEKFTSQSLVGYGYTHSVLLMTQITPPTEIKSTDKATLMADVSWLACNEQCVPGSQKVSLSLPVNSSPPIADASTASLFAQAREKLPVSSEGTLSISDEGQYFILKSAAAAETALFIPASQDVIEHDSQQFTKTDGGFSLAVKKSQPDISASSLQGVLLVSNSNGAAVKAMNVNPTLLASAAKTSAFSSILIAMGLAFVGGLILNVMPCVLPVIALKIFGFVKIAQEKRSAVLKHGGIFALGVLVSFWALSGLLLVLRAYGQSVGWGFQLQEPAFVAVLTAILFLLGLSLFGVFELGTSLISLGQKGTPSTEKSPLMSSFMSGVLATLVATPCTGPLLGPALGFAMTLPVVSALTIFSCMGLGMASPYLLFSAFPSLIRYLPKPGSWMIVFKQLMGFLMMATVIWLVWVFGAQTDQMAVSVLLGCLLLLAIGAWIFGKWATPAKRKKTRFAAIAASLCIFLVGSYGAIAVAKQQRSAPTSIEASEEGQWMVYTPEKVKTLREEGIPVFVDFTAKWCLICQANKVVLHSSELTKTFKEKGVVTMIGDWTKRDPAITQELQRLGRSGVPVYALYPANISKPPVLLPQTLTSGVVTDYLNELD